MESIKDYLRYDTLTGEFFWKVSRRCVLSGEKAGTINNRGYVAIKHKGKLHFAHRLAWYFVYGEMPNGNIDHIDHDKTNNRISNLRVVTQKQNAMNASISKRNKSGATGVGWCNKRKKWIASARIEGKNKYLGQFSTVEDARIARKLANIKAGFHENHGEKKSK